jgi:hypothetical protein
MLGNSYFYHQLFRKYVSLMGTIFNDITIERVDSDGDTIKIIPVPVTYAPKDKVLIRNGEEAVIQQFGKEIAVSLPIIAFEHVGWRYNGQDKQVSTHRWTHGQDDGSTSSNFVPVYYDLDWEVTVYVKNAEDGTKIIEQILPFFTPELTPKVSLIPEMGITVNIPIFLTGIECDDSYDGSPTVRRRIVWRLGFTMKRVPFYGPTKKDTLIKFANVSFYNVLTANVEHGVGNTDPSVRVTVQPGLTANGQPTSNVAETIPYTEIEVTDDFGYITIEYDPILGDGDSV